MWWAVANKNSVTSSYQVYPNLCLYLFPSSHCCQHSHGLCARLIGKDSDAGRDWGQEKGMTEDEMAGWHHRLNGHESEWTPGDGDGQGGLACCDSWGCKESDTTERLNWTELNNFIYSILFQIQLPETGHNENYSLFFFKQHWYMLKWNSVGYLQDTAFTLKDNTINQSHDSVFFKRKLYMQGIRERN